MTEFGYGIVAVILIVVMVVGFALAIANISKPTFNENDYDIITVYVEEGDTLYDYYYRYAKNGTEVTEYTSAIKELNHLRNSTIYAGTTLKVYKAK